MAIPWHPQHATELIKFANLVPLSLVMKSSDTSPLSVTTCRYGRLVIELEEHGTGVTMVGLILPLTHKEEKLTWLIQYV